jgi:hypothetical protein
MLPWEAGLQIQPAPTCLPSLSVVIPIYNAGRFLERTLRSLLCNDLSGVEIIVMDGGSTDTTPAILHHYRSMFAHVQSARDKGQSDAINQGMARAGSSLLYWLNGDDLVLPNALTAARSRFAEDAGCDVLVGNAYMTELDLRPIRHFVYGGDALRRETLLDYAKHHLVQPSVFFTRRAWDAAGPVALDMHYAMDADLFLRMASTFEFHHLDLDLAYSVYHEDCKTRSARAESITELAMVQARHGGWTQARATLDLLVDLQHGLERQAAEREVRPAGGAAAERVLRARIAELERRLALIASTCLEIDALETP